MAQVRVLVVDDEKQVLQSLRRLFQRRGCEVMTADGGEAALSQLESFRPDVIVTDFKMPGMDGAQLLSVAAARFPETKRVLLSGFAEVGETNLNATFLHKPWNTDQLLAACLDGARP
ncbi:MAG TPA: response regulator [Myxococcaceae bacterium]|jgi:YesN/AraC family two-component response regulator|nr:response regulator [Myxococcaceae bacterium]